MPPTASTACAAVAAAVLLTYCCCAASASTAAAAAAAAATPTFVEGPSLYEMSEFLEPLGRLLPFDSAADVPGSPFQPAAVDEGRGKKQKPMKMAMMMAGTAAGSMMLMKAMGAIKLFIIHSFFATKLGLIVAAYLLLCKMMEMKKAPSKPIKWVPPPPPPPHFDEHQPSPYGADAQQSYEPSHAEQQPPPQPLDMYGPPQHQQQQQQQHQFMPAGGDFGGGGGGDIQAHYSHVSPVTYRPMIHRNPQPDASVKSSSSSSSSSSSGRLR